MGRTAAAARMASRCSGAGAASSRMTTPSSSRRPIDACNTGVQRHMLGYRSRLIALVVCHACAEYERETHQGKQRPSGSWEAVGRFQVDAVTGLLLAPGDAPSG